MEKLQIWFAEKHGRKTALALHLGLTPGACSGWRSVPCRRLLAVAEFTGLQILELLKPLPEGATADRIVRDHAVVKHDVSRETSGKNETVSQDALAGDP